jgi:hypothetical protein
MKKVVVDANLNLVHHFLGSGSSDISIVKVGLGKNDYSRKVMRKRN